LASEDGGHVTVYVFKPPISNGSLPNFDTLKLSTVARFVNMFSYLANDWTVKDE